ncbi:hypothetical protein BB934_45230 (plasmid) [Microvirga ossetica]|uniref:Uncharacterized protein n=1 Tax=Microvirga ossetica TaxID=1882682 RepID=A0A1B2EZK5_9HYPH|nr:hypothetical protein [Microvirga ossetica]ANY85425.1 hypothetical protein BB934_45230 [Microvirga ossetica]
MRFWWMKTSEAWPDSSWLETSLTAFDEDRPHCEGDGLWDIYVGGVHQEPHGPQKGTWVWSVTATFPGPRCPFTTNGREETRKAAGQRVRETYEKMVAFYAANPWPGPQQTLPEYLIDSAGAAGDDDDASLEDALRQVRATWDLPRAAMRVTTATRRRSCEDRSRAGLSLPHPGPTLACAGLNP